MNLLATFLDTATRLGDRTAIVAGDGSQISFSDLARRSGALAEAWHKAGLRQGDRVVLAMPVGIDLYAAIAGLWRLGATIVFPEPTLGLPGLRHGVAIAQPRALLTSGIYGLVRVLVPQLWGVKLHLGIDTSTPGDRFTTLAPEHPALISFTSGSTGRPKAIVRSHAFMAAQDAALDPIIAPERDAEVDLVAFPVFVLANLARGTTSVLPNWRLRDPASADINAILRLIEHHRITRALAPPFIAEVLAQAPHLPLQTLMTGGGPVFPDLLLRLQQIMPKSADVIAVYGSTEAEPIAWQRASAVTSAQWQAMQQGAGLLAGQPIPAIDLTLINDEIVVTGEHVNKGYLNGQGDVDNKLNLDGQIWHRTGDAGALDADGALWLRGRHSSKTNGLYPFEVEVRARLWPGVQSAALVDIDGNAILAITGDATELPTWRKASGDIGIGTVVHLDAIPMDRRHRSKVDQAALRQKLRKALA